VVSREIHIFDVSKQMNIMTMVAKANSKELEVEES
jgi:hypothetical protein